MDIYYRDQIEAATGNATNNQLMGNPLKAVLCESFGPAENLLLAEIDRPELKPGHVLVDIRSCALNFPDVLMVEGKYQSLPPFPFTPGGEFAGVVNAVADDVSRWQVGDEVFGACGHGAMAEQISVAATALWPKPRQ